MAHVMAVEKLNTSDAFAAIASQGGIDEQQVQRLAEIRVVNDS